MDASIDFNEDSFSTSTQMDSSNELNSSVDLLGSETDNSIIIAETSVESKSFREGNDRELMLQVESDSFCKRNECEAIESDSFCKRNRNEALLSNDILKTNLGIPGNINVHESECLDVTLTEDVPHFDNVTHVDETILADLPVSKSDNC